MTTGRLVLARGCWIIRESVYGVYGDKEVQLLSFRKILECREIFQDTFSLKNQVRLYILFSGGKLRVLASMLVPLTEPRRHPIT